VCVCVCVCVCASFAHAAMRGKRALGEAEELVFRSRTAASHDNGSESTMQTIEKKRKKNEKSAR